MINTKFKNRENDMAKPDMSKIVSSKLKQKRQERLGSRFLQEKPIPLTKKQAEVYNKALENW